jgi:hypothetical protein
MSLLCHLALPAMFRVFISATLVLEEALDDFAEQRRKRLDYSQCCSFAGRPILLRSNSAVLLNHAIEFFSPRNDSAKLSGAAPQITLIMSDHESREHRDAPWFRGRGYFAVARFTSADTVWFNLRTRTAHGVLSRETISDPTRLRKDILPAIAGVLAPVMSVTPVHAACLATGGSGVLLAGISGTGKTTLSITLARLGYRFLSDEWTYLAESNGETQAWGLPVPVKLLPDAVNFFPELSSYRCAASLNGEFAYEVSPQECFTLSRAATCRVKCIVLLERCAERGCIIEPVSAAAGISRLVADIEPLTGKLKDAYEQQLALLRRMSRAVCIRARFNASPLYVARALHRALNHIFDRDPSDMNCAEASELSLLIRTK